MLLTKSPRLLAMSMDENGFIWLGSTHRFIYRYEPLTGDIEEIALPYDASTSSCLCAGDKVYLLGQSYPRLMVYHQREKRFSELPYPSPKPDVWYGTDAVDGRHLYLFDRGSVGVIKWDTQTDRGIVIPYPFETIMPSFGRYVPGDQSIWCGIWDYSNGQYKPVGISRLDLVRERFTDWFSFPTDDDALQPFTDSDSTLFYPNTLRGKLVPFDFKAKRWCTFLNVPEFGKRFGFIGLATVHGQRWYFSLSTYNGTATGCDGKPFHFCNGLLEFDPTTRTFAFPTLQRAKGFFQISYTLSARGHFFATGNNIEEADGTLNPGRIGEALFWQSLLPD